MTEHIALSPDEHARLMDELDIVPLWPNIDRILPTEPVAGYAPHHWSWQACERTVRTAREIVQPGEGAERRSLGHVHPELAATWSTTHTLKTAWQVLCPGEAAPEHRHSAEAIRFVLEGDAACHTVVADQPCPMEDFSLILTPAWTWHSHFNGGDRDVIWLDGLNTPINRHLRAIFFETVRPVKAADEPPSPSAAWSGRLLPVDLPGEHNPIACYPWAESERALGLLAGAARPSRFSASVAYVNPVTGGPTTPTMSCAAHALEPATIGATHRSNESQIFTVVSGEGSTICDGREIAWGPRDVFVIPPWTWVTHANRGTQPARLFSISDRPLLEAFHLYRSETADTLGAVS